MGLLINGEEALSPRWYLRESTDSLSHAHFFPLSSFRSFSFSLTHLTFLTLILFALFSLSLALFLLTCLVLTLALLLSITCFYSPCLLHSFSFCCLLYCSILCLLCSITQIAQSLLPRLSSWPRAVTRCWQVLCHCPSQNNHKESHQELQKRGGAYSS